LSLQLLIYRDGKIKISDSFIEYRFKPPILASDVDKLKKLCDSINKMSIKDDKKRLIKCKVGLRGS